MEPSGPQTQHPDPAATHAPDPWLQRLGRPANPDLPRTEPDPAAIEELRTILRKSLAKSLSRRGISDADLDDFSQEATVRVLARLDNFRGDSRFTTWAISVATRVALTHLRTRQWQARGQDVDADDYLGTRADPDAQRPDETLEKHAVLEALRRAIHENLTEKQRSALLAELGGAPTHLVAQRLGMTRGALYKLTHDARKRLKEALESAGYTDRDVSRALQGASHA